MVCRPERAHEKVQQYGLDLKLKAVKLSQLKGVDGACSTMSRVATVISAG